MSRHYTKEEISNYLDQYNNGEHKSVRAFCREFSITPSCMYDWIRKANAKETNDKALAPVTETIEFAEVTKELTEEIAKEVPEVTPETRSSGIALITKDIEIHINTDFDKNLLYDVLSVVKAL